MSFNSQNLIRSLNEPKRHNIKDNNYNLLPNVKPIYNPSRPIKNNFFPKNHIYNNHNFNIKVNVITKKKDNIIEGDLNFNDTTKPQKLASTHKSNFYINKAKKPRGMPRKSPLPIPRAFKPKDILNFNRIFTSKQRPNIKKYSKPNNIIQSQGINNQFFEGKISNNTTKSFYSLNIKNDRSHSPMLRSGQNKIVNIGMKPNKNRYVSKSPILGKSSSINKNRNNFGFSMFNNGNPVINKITKKTPSKPSNINKKINNINPNQKRNTVISGEIYQDSSKINKINYNINNKQNNVNIIHNIKPISKINVNNFINNNNNNNNNINNSNNLVQNAKSNNINNINNINIINRNDLNNKNNEKLINQSNNDKNKEINMINNFINNKEEINIRKIPNEENLKNNSEINQIIKNGKDNLNNNESIKNNDNKKQELMNKNNKRSQSQGPIDPLKKNDDLDNKNKINDKEKDKYETPKKVIKVIKSLLPYTHVGFDGEEPKENNQDNYFIFKNFAEHKDYIYMSVCDGHGVEGHFVSEFIKEVLPYYMSENLKERNILKETELVHKIITETFLIVNNMLVDNESINSLFSGSTCVSVIFTPEKLIVPNIGDSRAVLGRFDKKTGKFQAIELSRDHKPTEKDEAKRIIENDGRIQPFIEDGEFVGPQRVWIKDEEVPGLAMTRSFGDRVAATVGVISEPEIKEFLFDENDKFMIIASDGIWEFISSQECVDMIQSYYENNDLKGCCEYLYQESSKRWLKEEEVIDDTTLILVFFE